MLFSKSCEYALQAVIYLAAQPPNTPALQRDISTALDIPPHFLGKILQLLTRHDIVTSQKGKAGGFILKKPSEEISLYSIAKLIDGESFLDHCLIGFPGCYDDSPCPLHVEWTTAKKSIIQILKNRHVGELSEDVDIKLDYIKSQQNSQ